MYANAYCVRNVHNYNGQRVVYRGFLNIFLNFSIFHIQKGVQGKIGLELADIRNIFGATMLKLIIFFKKGLLIINKTCFKRFILPLQTILVLVMAIDKISRNNYSTFLLAKMLQTYPRSRLMDGRMDGWTQRQT